MHFVCQYGYVTAIPIPGRTTPSATGALAGIRSPSKNAKFIVNAIIQRVERPIGTSFKGILKYLLPEQKTTLSFAEMELCITAAELMLDFKIDEPKLPLATAIPCRAF